MKSRIDIQNASPGAVRAMLGLQDYVNQSGLESSLLELVKMRAALDCTQAVKHVGEDHVPDAAPPGAPYSNALALKRRLRVSRFLYCQIGRSRRKLQALRIVALVSSGRRSPSK